MCMTISLYPASEAGSDPHHLLPYLPALCWAYATMSRAALEGARQDQARAVHDRISLVLLFSLLFGYGPVLGISWGRTLHMFSSAPLAEEGIAEINQSLAANPALKMALGPGDAPFMVEGLEVIPVFHGNPLPIDTAAWMTIGSDGASERNLIDLIASCPVDVWLIPGTMPFGNAALFPPPVVAAFETNFHQVRTGRVFSEWRCNHAKLGSGSGNR
jgi:hypothetical protein